MRKTNNNVKVSKWDWAAFTDIEDLSVGDIDMIRRTLLLVRAGGINNTMQCFWTMVLLPYYDQVYFSHLNHDAACVLYRLSDLIAPEVRNTINVSSNNDGWITLDDWRLDFLEGLPRGEAQIPVIDGTPPDMSWV